MPEGYDDEHSAPLDEGMDEFLCEYVDGTMDPVVLKAFEEYLRANPQMAEHVQCLCQAKRFLAQQAACPHATSELQRKLRDAIAREQLGGAPVPSLGFRLGSAAWLTSAAGLMLMLGMLFGTVLMEYQTPSASEVVVEREAAPSDAHPVRTVRLPRGARASLGVIAPAVTLPALRTVAAPITPILRGDTLRAVLP